MGSNHIRWAMAAGAVIALFATADAVADETHRPYSYMVYGSIGAGIAYLTSAEIHPLIGIALPALVGVTKERSELDYNPKGAFATSVGVLMAGPLVKNRKYGGIIVTPTAIVYRLQFD